MNPQEYRAALALETKWKAKARRMPVGNGFRWAFVRSAPTEDVIEGRERDNMVSMLEIIVTDQAFADMARGGIELKPEVWRVAGSINAVAQIPLIVAVTAADGLFWAKVLVFPKAGETGRVLAGDFRPLGS